MDLMVAFTKSSYSSRCVDFLFIVVIRAAILPKIKAETTAPVIMMSEPTIVSALFYGASSLPVIVNTT
jgi:hypothetical protein